MLRMHVVLAAVLLFVRISSAQESCLPFLIEFCDGFPQDYECTKVTTSLTNDQGGESSSILQEYCFQVGSPLVQTLELVADAGTLDVGSLRVGDEVGEIRFDALLSTFGSECEHGDRALMVVPITVTSEDEQKVGLTAIIDEMTEPSPMINCLLQYNPTDELHNFGHFLEGDLEADPRGGFTMNLALAPLGPNALDPGLTLTDIRGTASPAPVYVQPITKEGLFTLPEEGGQMAVFTTLTAVNEADMDVVAEFEEEFEIQPGAGGTKFVRGDPDSDGSIQLTDGIVILGFLFLGSAAPACMDSGDADDSGDLVLTDAVLIFNWLFTGGLPPAEPTPSSASAYPGSDCAGDPIEDNLECETPGRVCQ